MRTADLLLALAVVALAGFPLAADLAASGQPREPAGATVSLPPLQRSPTAALRDVPVFTPGGEAERAVRAGAVLTDVSAMERALASMGRKLFGSGGAAQVQRTVATEDFRHPLTNDGPLADQIPYPFHYNPPLDTLFQRLLPRSLSRRQVDEANDFAGLLILTGRRFHAQNDAELLPSAASVAFALLDRARAGGSCRPQLNLAFLLSTDSNPRDDDTRDEFERAARACPGDATPLWLLGEFQSHRAFVVAGIDRVGSKKLPRSQRLVRPFATFHRLERAFPGSAAGWSGEADAELRLAYQQNPTQPFVARNRFRRALALYRRARSLDRDPGLSAGTARALAGLGRYGDAAAAAREALVGRPGAVAFEARLVEYLERDHQFARAADAAARLESPAARFPSGRGLYMSPNDTSDNAWDKALAAEVGQDPLSLGAERLRPVGLKVGPGPGGASAAVIDIGFIPTFHPVAGITDVRGWCPDWSRRRDLVLAGRPADALVRLPAKFTSVRPDDPGYLCPDGSLLAGVAELELGRPKGAERRVRQAGLDVSRYPRSRAPLLAFLSDARQNMHRFAGDLARAASVNEEWRRADPASSAPSVQAGEVAFLRRDFERAQGLFADAARLARKAGPPDPLGEADALLRLGTAHAMRGHTRKALDALTGADRLASAVVARLSPATSAGPWLRAAELSYDARAQAGDAALRARDWRLAARRYALARDRWNKDLAPDEDRMRPDVLANNQAAVEIQLARPATALRLSGEAVRQDPDNPIFLMNRGFAEQRLGRTDQARRTYAAAVRADSTLFPAANDLGVLLAKRGDKAGAASAFRQAVGAKPDYASGWFNLGVVLERMGPAHVLASQGALARAVRLDRTLRDREHSVVFDDLPYFTNLDLSKPLPPHWHFAEVQRHAPITVVALIVILIVGIRLGRLLLARLAGRDAIGETLRSGIERLSRAPLLVRLLALLCVLPVLVWFPVGRSLLKELLGSEAIRRWLQATQTRLGRLRWLRMALPPVVGVTVTVAVLLWPLAGSGPTSPIVVVLLGAGALVLIAVLFRARRAAAPRADHYTWTPSLLLGVGAAGAGLGWAPLPVPKADGSRPRRPWQGAAALTVLAAGALLLGHLTEVQLTRALASSALVMAASICTPIKPLEGAALSETRAGVGLNMALLAMGLALLTGF